MSWTYKGNEMLDITQFPDNTYGFVYINKHTPTGKSYIGKKILQFTKKVKLGKKEIAALGAVVGRKPSYKLSVKESDWKTYTGSSKELNEDIKKYGKEKFDFVILEWCDSKFELGYKEIKKQIMEDVLLSEDYYNGIINCRLGRVPKAFNVHESIS